ncbi:VWA domain-containing protein [Pararoseomonas sp. SCSIO 73927]|uniref:vWA domain-containing protein n=1 Tax=Pararoseomonas sp. SCSIO 73927 TaxID=3114537 RepID=UPI0030CC519A
MNPLRPALAALVAAWLVAAPPLPAAAQTARPGPAPAEAVPPDARALLDGLIEPEVARRCLPAVEMPPTEALPGQGAVGPAPRRAPASRVVVAVDASGSMAGATGAASGRETKMEAALRAARRFLDGLGQEVEVGLVVFGHRGNARNEGRAASCGSAEAVVPLAAGGRDAVGAALGRLRPVGWTPLAAGMEAAARQFRPSGREGEQLLLVISDGVETCGGDPVAVARRLNGGELRVVVDIVGFDIAERERAALAEVARAGGGDFANVSGRDAEEALRRSREGTLNAMAAIRARTGASIQAGRTQRVTNVAAARAQACVNLALSRENNGLVQRLLRLRAGGAEPLPAVAEEARGILRARHEAIRGALDAYVAAVREAREAQLAEIERNLVEALKPPAR